MASWGGGVWQVEPSCRAQPPAVPALLLLFTLIHPPPPQTQMGVRRRNRSARNGAEARGIVLSADARLTRLSSAFSPKALQHHQRRLDLHGAGVRPPRLPRHRHLQETARLHFTTLPLAAVCGTLSYALSVSLCVMLPVIHTQNALRPSPKAFFKMSDTKMILGKQKRIKLKSCLRS